MNGEVVCGRLSLGGQFHLVGSSAAMPYLSAAQEVPFVPEWPRLQEKKAACSRRALGRREGEPGGEGVDGKPKMGRNCIRSRAITLPAPADAALHPHCILALCCNWLDA